MDDISKYGFPSPLTVVIISPVPWPGPAGPKRHSGEPGAEQGF